jgi:hypothetical protein
LVLSPKPRNRRCDFDAQITKPELPILRPKSGNPPPPWFWGSTKKPTTSFGAKSGQTVTTSFEAKLEKTVTTGFEAKPAKIVAADFEAKLLETVVTGFEAKPAKIVTAGFEAKPLETVVIGFEAKPLTNRQPWFWGSTKKPALIIYTYQVQTAHDATRPLDHPATEYPTCATILGPLHQVSYSYHDPHRYMLCRTCHLHITRQANTILQTKQR